MSKAEAWLSRWAYAWEPRWHRVGAGYSPRPPAGVVHAGAQVLPETNESVRTIRALEAQINANQKETV